jgi:hypothetical protein
MTKEELKKLGFKQLPHFTICSNMILDLGRDRHLSIGNLGTPNEMMFICQSDKDNNVSDLVCVHNYDYDGFLTAKKLKFLIKGLAIDSTKVK